MAFLDLQICMEGWQWTLHPHFTIKVWRLGRHELVAELPLTLVSNILAHYLTQAHLTAAIMDPPEPSRRPLASAPARSGLLRLGVPEKSLREARAARRRARRRQSGVT